MTYKNVKILDFTLSFLFLIFYISILATPLISFADTLSNVGIIKSGIWYSKDPFYAGDKIRIYTLVFNGGEYDLLGDLTFDDNGKVICTGNFSAASGRTQELWCDWTATIGTHKISAKIINPKVSPIGESPRTIILENNVSGVSEKKVTLPPQKEEESLVSVPRIASSSATSTSTLIEKGLDSFKDIVLQVLPEKITSQDVVSQGDAVASATPKTIREGVGKVMEKIGAEKLKTPVMFIVDFLVVVYNFLMRQPVVLIALLSFIVWKFAKYLYGRLV
ncbi:MAG TPA: hypothetical protein P5056_01260 [Candidatus Paceibacterota bacterium]|nr:hypothetical protein [Candidatus Paceibacterota bacterium]